jgi:streptogramin lyase
VNRPAGSAADPTAANVLWMTLQNELGGLARFVYTSEQQTRFDSYALPISGLRPTGIAVAADRGVWFGAFMPFKIFLPVVLKT